MITKRDFIMKFDTILKIFTGHLMGTELRTAIKFGNVGGGYTFENIMQYHKKLGHPLIELTRKTAKMNNVKLIGLIEKCDSCI